MSGRSDRRWQPRLHDCDDRVPHTAPSPRVHDLLQALPQPRRRGGATGQHAEDGVTVINKNDGEDCCLPSRVPGELTGGEVSEHETVVTRIGEVPGFRGSGVPTRHSLFEPLRGHHTG